MENLKMTQISKKIAYITALIIVTLWGTTFALSKLIVPNPLSPPVFVAFRSFFGFLILFLILVIKKEMKAWWGVFTKNLKQFMIIGGIYYTFAYLIQYWAIIHTTAINQAIISNTQTFFAILLNFLLYKKRTTRRFISGAFIGFIGISLVILSDGNSLSLTGSNLKGNILSLLAFFFWGGYSIVSKDISGREKPIYVITSMLFVSSIILVPVGLISGMTIQLNQLDSTQWIILLYFTIFTTIITFLLWAVALSNKKLRGENIVIITILNPIVGTITSYFLFGITPNPFQYIGMAIVIFAMIFANYDKSQSKSDDEKQDA